MTTEPQISPPPPQSPKKSPISNAQWLCYFLIVFTGYLFATRPTNTTGQLIFRLALLLVGVGGLVVISLAKKNREE